MHFLLFFHIKKIDQVIFLYLIVEDFVAKEIIYFYFLFHIFLL
jgi:hypothetical protein